MTTGEKVRPPGAPTTSYTVAAVTDRDALERLTGEWHRLLLTSTTATAFVSPAWLLTWYRHFQPRAGLYVVTVWDGDTLVGLAPFARTRLGAGPTAVSLLVSAGTEHGDYGDPLLGGDTVTVARLIVDHLVGLVRRGTTVVNLRRLRSDDPVLALVEDRDDVHCEPMGRAAENVVVRFADMDDPEATLRRAARKRDLPRLARRLTEDRGEIEFVPDTKDVTGALDDMRYFLSQRWQAGEGPKLFATPAREAFTRDATEALVAAGLARVSTLTVGGRTAAVTIDQRVGDRMVGDATSFDPALRRYSVGLMHLDHVLRHALTDGVAEVDLRAGDFPYKDQWATTHHATRSVALVRPGPIGRAQLGGRRVAMSLRARRLARGDHLAPPSSRWWLRRPRPPAASPVGPTATPAVSVVIPVRNGEESLGLQLAALAHQDVPVPWEVVVADNGSTDDTRALVAGFTDRVPVRVVDAADATGINHARNIGATRARGELLLFCDADDVVQPGWIAGYWATRDGWDMAGGRVDGTTLNPPEVAARQPDWTFGDGLATFGWLPTFMGCNFAVHRHVFDAIGGFDETFVAGNDDIDFAFRGQLAGHELGYVRDAVVAYRLRETVRATVRQRYHYGRTRAHLYRKFAASGMPRRSWKHTLRSYGLLVGRIPHALGPTGRARWAIDAAFLVGLAVGSLHDHTIYLSE